MPLNIRKSQIIKGNHAKKLTFDDDSKDNSQGDLPDAEDQKTLNHKQQQRKTNKPETKSKSKVNSGNAALHRNADDQLNQKWFEIFKQFPVSEELADMKHADELNLMNLCRSAYEEEKSKFLKKNPSDYRWLQTALHKGTANDRANAGALLLASNPLGNLEALASLIAFAKLSNKSLDEVIKTIVNLWKEVLLPTHRKLYSISMRAADWKVLKDSTFDKERRTIYAYWHFEDKLKEMYFEFLKNIRQIMHMGQTNQKAIAILAATQLLIYSPEKEQMLLTMLINKLGDPISKVASKALHHLIEIAYRHPNMCSIIVGEVEKLLFRNNVAERAQHFALCYLSSIVRAGGLVISTKLIRICFALFKVLVQKGAINNRTMQAILRCLKNAIETLNLQGTTVAKTADTSELLDKNMQDTIYRMVHLSDITISVQTLSLLLQLIVAEKASKRDRFYNALYGKLLDANLTTVGVKTAAQFLHIVHKAIHIDTNRLRACAFIKRLLQLALYVPSNMAAGILIIIHKILTTRHELNMNSYTNPNPNSEQKTNQMTDDYDRDRLQSESQVTASIMEMKCNLEPVDNVNDQTSLVENSQSSDTKDATNAASDSEAIKFKYDPFKRTAAYAGAEYAAKTELLILQKHAHPTVQVFASNIIENKRIDYYGDPLKDFGLPHFLERFAFKNPKKISQQQEGGEEKLPIIPTLRKHYLPNGSRGMPVNLLTTSNCTEDEKFIFNFFEQKRQRAALYQQSDIGKNRKRIDEDDESIVGDVDDDEFHNYLDNYFGSKKHKEDDLNSDDEELAKYDFLKEIDEDFNNVGKKQKVKTKARKNDNDDDIDDIGDDWGSEDEQGESDDAEDTLDFENDDNESLSEDIETDDDDDDDSDEQNDSEMDDEENLMATNLRKSRKRSTSNRKDDHNFAKKLKSSKDVSSLFAAADDFADLLEETAKTKGQGTINAIFNRDGTSDKHLKWEEKRRSNAKTYYSRKSHNNNNNNKTTTKRIRSSVVKKKQKHKLGKKKAK